jgi:hypothetical protein
VSHSRSGGCWPSHRGRPGRARCGRSRWGRRPRSCRRRGSARPPRPSAGAPGSRTAHRADCGRACAGSWRPCLRNLRLGLGQLAPRRFGSGRASRTAGLPRCRRAPESPRRARSTPGPFPRLHERAVAGGGAEAGIRGMAAVDRQEQQIGPSGGVAGVALLVQEVSVLQRQRGQVAGTGADQGPASRWASSCSKAIRPSASACPRNRVSRGGTGVVSGLGARSPRRSSAGLRGPPSGRPRVVGARPNRQEGQPCR